MFDTCETRRCVEIPILNDKILEMDESFSVHIEETPDIDNIILNTVYAEVQIIDDDGMYSLETWSK